MDVRLSHPFSMLVSGGRGVGKTEFTKKLLNNHRQHIHPMIKRVVWFYAKHQPNLFEDLHKIFGGSIEYINGIPENLDEMFDRNVTNLIIFDDMMDEVGDDRRITQLFTRGRHDNLSVIFLTQNLFHSKQRALSLNSDYIVIFKNPRDKSQFSHLARQLMPDNSRFMQWAFTDATKLPHSYLFLDLKPETDDRYRVRTNIIPKEIQPNNFNKDIFENAIQHVYIPK